MDSNEGTVTATNEDGITREFSKTQWQMLGDSKGGWSTNQPGEVNAIGQALATARANYTSATGTAAPSAMTAEGLQAVADAVNAFKATQPAPVAVTVAPALPVPGLVDDAVTARADADAAEAEASAEDAKAAAAGIDYKRPRSTEEARTKYAEVIGTEAVADASYTTLVTEIEAKLGIVK